MSSLRSLRTVLCLVASLFAANLQTIASTPNSELLALIPGDSQVVAGMEAHNERRHGHLLFATRDNGVDWDDWLSLCGVDPAVGVNSLITVATSSSRGELKEHLLVVEGTFNRASIFRAAEQDGAARTNYNGEEVLVVEPFSREQAEMRDTRWLAIIDARLTIFGTPSLVQQALDRRAAHSAPDLRLVARLAQLGPGISSWAILKMPPSIFARHLDSEELNPAWREFLATADELTVGIRYGYSFQLNFAVHTTEPFLSSGGTTEPARPRLLRSGLSQISRLRLRSLEAHEQQLSGSIVIPPNALDGVLSVIFGMRLR